MFFVSATFIAGIAHATTIVSQTTNTGHSTLGPGDNSHGFAEYLGLMPASTSITEASFWYETDQPSTAYFGFSACDNPGYLQETMTCTNALNFYPIGGATLATTSEKTFGVLYYNNVDVSNRYLTLWTSGIGSAYFFSVYGSNSDSYPNGYCTYFGGGATSTCPNSMLDMGFIVSYTPTSSATIFFPGDNSTVNGDFNFWNLNLNFTPSSTTYVTVDYGQFGFTNSEQPLIFSSSGESPAINGIFNLAKNRTLAQDTIYIARIRVYSDAGTIYVGPTISFSIHGLQTLNSYYNVIDFNNGNPSSTIEQARCTDSSSTLLGFDLGKALCNVGVFLFVPSNNSFQQFHSIPSMIMTKIPFVYVGGVVTALTSYSTTTQSFPTIQLAGIKMDGSTSTKVTIFATSTIDKYYTASYRIFFRNLMLWSFYAWIAVIAWAEAEKLLK